MEKRMKFFIAFALFFVCAVANAQQVQQIDGIYYTLNAPERGQATVTYPQGRGSGNFTYEGDIVIPSTVTYRGTSYTVTAIQGAEGREDGAFAGSDVTSITLPETIVTIGAGAFDDCDQLESLVITSPTPPTCEENRNGETALDTLPEGVEIEIPEGAEDAYLGDEGWSDNIPTETMTLTLTDGTSTFSNITERTYGTVKYVRTFNNTNWQALYIPFSLTYDQWKDYFDIAYINDVHQYDDDSDGVIDRTEVEIIYQLSGSTTANTPYMIRAKQTGENTIELNDVIVAVAENSSIDCSSTRTLYTFTGTYSAIDGVTMLGSGYYAMGGGSLIKASDESAGLGAFRWYLSVESRTSTAAQPAEIRIRLIDNTTAIETVESNVAENNVYYDLSGRRVDNPTKGIYIVNGEKKIIK